MDVLGEPRQTERGNLVGEEFERELRDDRHSADRHPKGSFLTQHRVSALPGLVLVEADHHGQSDRGRGQNLLSAHRGLPVSAEWTDVSAHLYYLRTILRNENTPRREHVPDTLGHTRITIRKDDNVLTTTHTHTWRGSWRFHLFRGARRCTTCPMVQIGRGRGRHVIGYESESR